MIILTFVETVHRRARSFAEIEHTFLVPARPVIGQEVQREWSMERWDWPEGLRERQKSPEGMGLGACQYQEVSYERGQIILPPKSPDRMMIRRRPGV